MTSPYRLGKNKVAPEYNIRPTGPQNRQRFLCELRAPGFDYTACGNSTNKKDAQANAAKDFVAYLVRQGRMQGSEVPSAAGVEATGGAAASGGLGLSQRPVFRQGFGPDQLGQAYRPMGDGEGGDNNSQGNYNFRQQFLEQRDKKMTEQAEDADVNSAIHGKSKEIQQRKHEIEQVGEEEPLRIHFRFY